MTIAEQTHLNLARKWRPQTFDTVLGQDIPMRMLKNSLYLNKFFPVYLFAGQRGCGKTTSARIFAAAVNCQNLAVFQKNPQSPIPCLTCNSCLAMHQGNHPDFIEIDAASHTGVDNVRNIIDSSGYMPLIGQRKVYLIDEAHMLSKAAFNAFLKLLEEPPKNVIFMMATTESSKIPTTVVSRCFQLIFPALPHATLHTMITEMCAKEGVVIDEGAITILLQETEGSARDAINLLERVRFSTDVITEEVMLNVLGKMSTKTLITLMTAIIAMQPAQVLQTFTGIGTQTQSPHALWDGLIQITKTLLWIKYGITDVPLEYQQVKQELIALAASSSRSRLHAILTLLWHQEGIFNQTSKKQLFIETVLLQLCEQTNIADLQDLLAGIKNSSGGSNNSLQPPSKPQVTQLAPPSIPPKQTAQSNNAQQALQQAPPATVALDAATSNTITSAAAPSTPAYSSQWSAFMSKIQNTADQLLISIFSQAVFIATNNTDRNVTIALSSNSSFFKNKIDDTSAIWRPLLQEAFDGCSTILYSPQQAQPVPIARTISTSTTQAAAAPAPTPTPSQTPRFTPREKDAFLVIKDAQEWPKASLLLEAFSGKIKKVSDNQP